MKIFARLTFALLAAVACVALLSRLNAAAQTSQPAKTAPKSAPKKPNVKADEAAAQRQRVTAQAQGEIRRAVDQLRRYQAYEARLDETVNIGGRAFTARGRYVKGRELRMRLELKIGFGYPAKPTEAELLQVCDGQILISLQTVNGKSRLTRRNVRQIQQAAALSTHPGARGWKTAMGLGGLPELLASVAQTMVFDDYKEQTIGGERLNVYEGSWNPYYAQTFLRQGGNEMPAHVPDRVRIYFDNRYLLRRVEYLKRSKDDALEPMLTMGFKIRLNSKIDESVFELPKRTEYTTDVTNDYLRLFQPPPAAKPKAR